MKHISTPAILAMVCVSALMGTISAYAQNQTGMLELGGNIQIIGPATSISYPTFFIPETGTEKLHTVLDPVIPDNRFSIYDSLTDKAFGVTVSMTDLESPDGQDIDYRNISIVTLSSLGTRVDIAPYNNPPDPDNVSTPASCNDWQSSSGDTLATMDTKCGSIMDTAVSLFNETAPLSSTLAVLTAQDSPTIEVTDGSVFILPPPGNVYKVRISNDLVTYSGIIGNTLTGVAHMDEIHFPGEPVTQHPLVSGQLTIMQNLSAADTGLYSVGLGLRLVVDASFKQGDYSGTLTMTLLP